MKQHRLVGLALLAMIPAYAEWDNHHFYRASYFFNEPRLEKNLLSTLQASIAGGATDKSRNANGSTVALFDLFGPSNMQVLGNGVPNKNPNNAADLSLINLARLPSNNCFAQFSIPGDFKIIEAYFDYYQNLACGFFLQLDIPLRSMRINPKRFHDLSSNSPQAFPNINAPQWQDFLANFNLIMNQYNLSIDPVKETGIGDITVLLGWTNNWQRTQLLDFVDTTFQVGVITPTGKAKNQDQVFSLPLGYDKHLGVALSADFSIGLYSWLTSGLHAGVIAFTDRCQEIRIKTDLNQSGMIKLAKARSNVGYGPIWDLGVFVKADHLARGLSLLAGYTFVTKENDSVCPLDSVSTGTGNISTVPSQFNTTVANTDAMLKGFAMSTIHLEMEYDFTRENSRFGPRVALIYNAQVGGRRIFKTNMLGAYLGLDIAWCLD